MFSKIAPPSGVNRLRDRDLHRRLTVTQPIYTITDILVKSYYLLRLPRGTGHTIAGQGEGDIQLQIATPISDMVYIPQEKEYSLLGSL
jgi:hypothetical protein